MQPPQLKYYQSKYNKLSGSSYRELINKAHAIANSYNPNPKRKAYVRSKFFNGDKIFLEYFWQHQNNKPPADKRRRIVYFAAALDVVQNSRHKPNVEPSKTNKNEIWYTFYGQTKSGDKFAVHIKKSLRNNEYLMSVFPL
jgi:hypothetical protein